MLIAPHERGAGAPRQTEILLYMVTSFRFGMMGPIACSRMTLSLLWRLRFFGGIVLFCTNKSFEGEGLADRRKATLSEGLVKRPFIIVIHYTK